MKVVLKTWVIIEGDPDENLDMDTVMHEGHLWLVPTWLDRLGQGFSTPERIIRLTGLSYEAWPTKEGWLRLLDKLPREVVHGANPRVPGFQVRLKPDIRFAIPPKKMN